MMRISGLLLLALLLVGCGTGAPAGYQATVAAAAAGIGVTEEAVTSFTVLVSGDVQFDADEVSAERRADGSVSLHFFNEETAQGVSITLPANAAVGRLNLTDGVLVLTRIPSTPDTLYNLNPSGFFNLTSAGERLSGEFNLSVENAAGRRVTASGEFVSLPVESE